MADLNGARDAAGGALPWAFFATVTVLALHERFVEVPAAVVAFAGARWVFGLDRDVRRASSRRR